MHPACAVLELHKAGVCAWTAPSQDESRRWRSASALLLARLGEAPDSTARANRADCASVQSFVPHVSRRAFAPHLAPYFAPHCAHTRAAFRTTPQAALSST